MKRIITLLVFTILCTSLSISEAQTADEIIDNYLENIGGQEAWEDVENMKVTGIGRQQGIDYPFVATYMSDGRYVIDVDLQGTSFIIEAFDGENAWFTNFQTQKAETTDSNTSINISNTSKDLIVSPFYKYKEKGYTVELVGKEDIEGTDSFKIKLIKKPLVKDGESVENVEIYYFDSDNMVPIYSQINRTVINPIQVSSDEIVYSDYQEVDNKYVPFTQIEKFNGFTAIEMILKNIEFNVEVDEQVFQMPKD